MKKNFSFQRLFPRLRHLILERGRGCWAKAWIGLAGEIESQQTWDLGPHTPKESLKLLWTTGLIRGWRGKILNFPSFPTTDQGYSAMSWEPAPTCSPGIPKRTLSSRDTRGVSTTLQAVAVESNTKASMQLCSGINGERSHGNFYSAAFKQTVTAGSRRTRGLVSVLCCCILCKGSDLAHYDGFCIKHLLWKIRELQLSKLLGVVGVVVIYSREKKIKSTSHASLNKGLVCMPAVRMGKAG